MRWFRHDVLGETEPAFRHRREHGALVWNGGWQHVVERGDAVGGDDQQVVVQVVDITHFPAVQQPQARQVSLSNRARGHVGLTSACRAGVAGTASSFKPSLS